MTLRLVRLWPPTLHLNSLMSALWGKAHIFDGKADIRSAGER